VTDNGNFRTILSDSVARFVEPIDRAYFAGGMPLGLWTPIFTTADVTRAMEEVIQNLPALKAAAKTFTFKSWAAVCDGLLEDILSLTGAGQVSTAIVPVRS
jgi:hypothetical protein